MLTIPLGLKLAVAPLWGALKKIPYQVWFLIGGAIALWGYGNWQYNRGEAAVQGRWDASVKQAKALVKPLVTEQAKITERVVTKYVDRIKVVHEKAKVITQLIPTYIPSDACDLPPGFRVLHDASANNTIPGSAEEINAAPVPVRVATKTITDNYTSCHETEETLISLQEWVAEQRRAYLALCAQEGVDCK